MKHQQWNDIENYLSELEPFDITFEESETIEFPVKYGAMRQYYFRIPYNSPYDHEIIEMLIKHSGPYCFEEKIDYDLIDIGNPEKTLENIYLYKKDNDLICQLNYILD